MLAQVVKDFMSLQCTVLMFLAESFLVERNFDQFQQCNLSQLREDSNVRDCTDETDQCPKLRFGGSNFLMTYCFTTLVNQHSVEAVPSIIAMRRVG